MHRSNETKTSALRAIEYATSIAIELLSKLDNARAQIRTLKTDEDGRMIVTPPNALVVNAAVENAFQQCRAITKVTDDKD